VYEYFSPKHLQCTVRSLGESHHEILGLRADPLETIKHLI
jgi:hypothetical protein